MGVLETMSEAITYAFSLYAVLFMGGCVLLVSRRGMQPLKFRGARLTLCSALGGFALSLWLVVYLSCRSGVLSVSCQDIFCEPWRWIVALCYPMLVTPYALRCYRVIRLVDMAQKEKGKQRRAKYWDRPFIRERTLLKVLLAVCLSVVAIAAVIRQLPGDVTFVSMYGCKDSTPYTGWLWGAWFAVNLIEVLLCIFVAVKLTRIRDDFGMASELSSVAAVWGLTSASVFVGMLVFDAFETGVEQNVYVDVHAMLVLGRNVLLFCISVVFPVAASYSQSYAALWANEDALESLTTVLRDITCIRYFYTYLQEEASEEYLLCWTDVDVQLDLLRATAEEGDAKRDSEEALETLQTVYYTFIAVGAETEVHVNSAVSTNLRHIINQNNVSVANAVLCLTALSKELFQALNAHYTRFLQSEQCRLCLQELHDEDTLREMLQKSGMV